MVWAASGAVATPSAPSLQLLCLVGERTFELLQLRGKVSTGSS